jgi:glycosyltransferase involved in cell wall biosynthesis
MSPLRRVKDLLADAKIYVHCALNEHFGISIVEAMAAGCVPVVHDSGGPREIVSDDVGYRWNSVTEAITQISSLVGNDSPRKELSQAAALRAEQFTPEAFERDMGKVIQQFQK